LCTYNKNKSVISIIRFFIEKGIDINSKTKYGSNALTLLCENYKQENLIDIIRLVIENGIDINCKNKYGKNALTLLSANYKNKNCIVVIKFLIKSGFNVTEETRDYFQRNYLKKNRKEILQLLHV
jgi:ankyrin repeat protein